MQQKTADYRFSNKKNSKDEIGVFQKLLTNAMTHGRLGLRQKPNIFFKLWDPQITPKMTIKDIRMQNVSSIPKVLSTIIIVNAI